MLYEVLYYRDTANRIRSWQVEVEGNSYRVISGLVDGKKVISKWKAAKAKNVGKKNATTAEEQAHAEAKALYVKARKQGCAETVEAITQPYLQPMLAYKMKDFKKGLPFGKKKFWIQPKFDGFRCIGTPERLHSRTGETFINCQHIESAIHSFIQNNSNIVKALDGELYNHEYRDNFNKLSSLLRLEEVTWLEKEEIQNKIQYHVYDFMPVDPEMTYEQRLNFLTNLMPKTQSLQLAKTVEISSQNEADYWKQAFIEQGYEGAIIRSNDPYQNKRSKSVVKYKRLEDAEFEIDEIIEGKGNWSGMAKSVVLKLPNGKKTRSGMRGDEEFCRKILQEANFWIGKKATVEFDGYTPDGLLRFPIVTKWHDGKLEKR